MLRTVTVIDNFDSFTFNLVQYLQELGLTVEVARNNATTVAAVISKQPLFVVLSPGPSVPAKAGICIELIHACAAARVPLLGVCLGHQAIGEAFGGKVVRADIPTHGKVGAIHHQGSASFRGLPSPFAATRYHSLVVEEATLPKCLQVTARLAGGMIMGLKHETLNIEGVQFHPESVLTEHGHALLRNFAQAAGALPEQS